MAIEQEVVPFVTKVRTSGNSFVTTVPKEIIEALGLRAGDLLRISAMKLKWRELGEDGKANKVAVQSEAGNPALLNLLPQSSENFLYGSLFPSWHLFGAVTEM